MRRARFYLSTLCLLLSVLVVTYLSASYFSFFTIKQIEITGAKRVSPKEILKRSGLIAGKTNILFFDGKVIKEIANNNWITSVRIRREMPQKVIIEVDEAEPFCIFVAEDSSLYYMTESGKKLGAANFDEGLDFPVLIGDGIWKPDLLGDALAILKLSQKSSALNWVEISEVNLDSIYGITIFTNDGRRVDFGMNNIERKWSKVERIIKHVRSMNLAEEYINITSEKNGIVSFKI